MNWNTIGLTILNYAVLVATAWFVVGVFIIVISLIVDKLYN